MSFTQLEISFMLRFSFDISEKHSEFAFNFYLQFSRYTEGTFSTGSELEANMTP